MMSSAAITFAKQDAWWARFVAVYQDAAARAADTVEAAWQDILSTRAAVAGQTPLLTPYTPPGDLSELASQFVEHGKVLVAEPANSWLTKRPIRACTAALQHFANAADVALREVPESLPIRDALTAMQAGEPLRLPRFRNPETAYPLRAVVRTVVARRDLEVSMAFGQLHPQFVAACLQMMEPSRLWRQAQGQAVSGRPLSEALIRSELSRWRDECDSDAAQTNALVTRFCIKLRSTGEEVRQKLKRLPRPASERRLFILDQRRQREHTGWAAGQRTLQLFLEGSVGGLELARESTSLTAEWLLNVVEENQQLQRELDEGISWLRANRYSKGASAFPRPSGNVTPPEEQAESWLKRLTAIAMERLPAISERVLHPHDSRPARFGLKTKPQEIFRELLADAKPVAVAAFRGPALVNAEIARDLEEAREVIAFADEAPVEDISPRSGEIPREAYTNALAMLEERAGLAGIDTRALETRLLSVLVSVLTETESAKERGRLGALAYSARSGWRRVIIEAGAAGQRFVHSASQSIAADIRRVRESVYQKIGLLPPRWDVNQPVRERSRLETVLQLRSDARKLPVIYDRLFRLEPVTDPRFLIGRDEEMAALGAAYSRWMAGHHAIVLLAGARGSGKTSLLNCAESAIFKGAPMFRLGFHRRMRNWDDIHSFLYSNLSLSAEDDLENQLGAERRIIVLEEFERSFLRVAGGFDAGRRLLELIEATSASTMWILVLNRAALSLAEATLKLKQFVTLEINAMALSEETLRSVILQRHSLSGLRLRFIGQTTPENPGLARIRRALGLERPPSDLFFESLYRESQGVFRAAFELWQDCIQEIEPGALVMRSPLRPNYAPLHAEISLEDALAIHAVTIHGGLTVEELSEVLDIALGESRRRLSRLQDLELVEPEPASPGFRIRPQAIRLVVEILRIRNLI